MIYGGYVDYEYFITEDFDYVWWRTPHRELSDGYKDMIARNKNHGGEIISVDVLTKSDKEPQTNSEDYAHSSEKNGDVCESKGLEWDLYGSFSETENETDYDGETSISLIAKNGDALYITINWSTYYRDESNAEKEADVTDFLNTVRTNLRRSGITNFKSESNKRIAYEKGVSKRFSYTGNDSGVDVHGFAQVTIIEGYAVIYVAEVEDDNNLQSIENIINSLTIDQ